MEKASKTTHWIWLAPQVMTVLLILYVISLYNFALFHSCIELLNIVVAFGIFIVAWNSREFNDNDFLVWMGIAFLFVGAIDLLQLISQPEFSIFQGYGANLSQQLRTAGRFVEAFSFLIAFAAVGRKVTVRPIFLGYLVIFLLILFSIFYWNIFPTAFVPGAGSTTFKKISDYIIVMIFLASLVMLAKKRDKLDKEFTVFLFLALAFEIFCVLTLTPYAGVYSSANLLGHSLRFVAFFFLYKAVIEGGLMKPYAILFGDLSKKDQLLKESETKYRLVADSTYDWVVWTNPEHKFIYASPSSEKITGHVVAEFLADPGILSKIIYPDDRPFFEKHRDEVECTKQAGQLEFRIVLPDGSVRWMSHVCQPVFDAEKNFLGIRSSNRDISERKLIGEKLERAYAELEDRVKSRTGELRAANLKLKLEKEHLIESYKHLGITNRKISLLLELYKIPPSKKNKHKLAHYVLNVATNFSQADGGALYGYDDGEHIFKCLLATDADQGGSVVKYIPAVAGTFWPKLIREKQQVFGNFSGYELDSLNADKKFKNFLLLPLVKEERLKGFIFLEFKQEKIMTGLDAEFYEIFALHASQTLDASGVFAS